MLAKRETGLSFVHEFFLRHSRLFGVANAPVSVRCAKGHMDKGMDALNGRVLALKKCMYYHKLANRYYKLPNTSWARASTTQL